MYTFTSRLPLAILLLSVSPGLGAEPATSERIGATPYVPAIWNMSRPGAVGLLLDFGTLPDYAFKKVSLRSKQLGKKIVTEEFPAWERIFKASHETTVTESELLLFLLQLDPYWKEGANRTAVLVECREKLGHLPPDAVRTWQAALSKKTGSTANRLSVIGFLIQSDEINPDCKFDEMKSKFMLERLNGLPAEATKFWQDAFKLDTHQAAMSIIESKEFFDDASHFKDETFRKAVESRKEAPVTKAVSPKAVESDPEKVASSKLNLARSLLKSNKVAAKKRLEEIVKDYPGTVAAKEAEDLLKSQ